mgnify:FL=1
MENKYEGIQVCGFKISITELIKQYEVQFVFKNSDNIDKRMNTAINYLGNEGFFKEKKRIKATAIQLGSGNYWATSEDPNE